MAVAVDSGRAGRRDHLENDRVTRAARHVEAVMREHIARRSVTVDGGETVGHAL
ncbi:hypothetical protein ABZZ79_06895 [Streptomyces sp. NPDC006458]|uniref:hypothetical protein n=1 Tax=Streptomyces sp. NPDC006458 TaxID=3154302 RepID=UPI0033A9DD13